MSRGQVMVAAGAAVVLLAGLGVAGAQRADRSEPFDESAAVAAFRSPSPSPSPAPAAAAPTVPVPVPSGPSPSAAAPGAVATAAPTRTSPPPAAAPSGAPAPARDEVPPGVYRYTTTGHEQVDVLGGARHDYPATTTVTYSRSGCGTEERWQPLEGRVGVAVQCSGSVGSELRSTYQEREFFGQSQSKTYTCDPGVLLRPRDPRPGQTWTGRCTSEDSTIALAGRVVALEDLDVAGTRVPVVRLAIRGTLTGSTRGRSDREVWLARADGLMVQATGDTDTDADTAGGTVRYRETYRLRLQSLQPRR